DIVQRVLRTGQSEESDLFTSRISKRVVITVYYRVGFGDLVLSGALPVEYLSDVLRSAVPADRIAVVLDRAGTVIARNRNPQARTGQLAGRELRQYIASAREGSVTLGALPDAGSFAAFPHLANGWTAAIQVPPEIIAQPMRAWERQVLLNLIFFAALAI